MQKGRPFAVSTLVNRANKYLWWSNAVSNPIMGCSFDTVSDSSVIILSVNELRGVVVIVVRVMEVSRLRYAFMLLYMFCVIEMIILHVGSS